MKKYIHIILVGMKHTGKSTTGALLAKKLGESFYDTDNIITQISGKTPRELYDEGGQTLMKDWETASCRYLADLTRENGSVIATGGGIADNPDALNILKSDGLFIYLETPFDILFERIMESAARDGQLPPFLTGPDPKGLFLELFTRRTAIYAMGADVHLHAGNKTPIEITQEITDYISYERRTNIRC